MKLETLKQKQRKLELQKQKYLEKHSIQNLKAEYISCRKCGSKLKKSLLSNDLCPLCRTDLKSGAITNRIKEYDKQIKDLLRDIENFKDNEERRKTGYFELCSWKECVNEVDEKIKQYLISVYGDEFRYAHCAEGNEYIFVSTKDYNHAKQYFSAWYDAYLFDKEGCLIQRYRRYIEGSSYSSFFIDKVVWNDNKFKLHMRSHIHAYSKCDDEYAAVWPITIYPTTIGSKEISISRNPFIFVDRHSERDISVCNDIFNNGDGTYITFEDMKGYSALELSESHNLRVKMH